MMYIIILYIILAHIFYISSRKEHDGARLVLQMEIGIKCLAHYVDDQQYRNQRYVANINGSRDRMRDLNGDIVIICKILFELITGLEVTKRAAVAWERGR